MKKICSIILSMILSCSLIFASACSGSEETADGPFDVTVTANEGGRVSVPIEQVMFGENLAISVKPNTGYRVKEFKINGEKISIVGDTYTEYCITEDLNIEVVFASKYTMVKFDTAGRNAIQDKRFTIDSWYSDLPVAVSDNLDDLFVGWYTQPNGQGTYVVNSSRVPEAPHTLYAHFISKRVVDGETLNKALYKEYSVAVTYYNQEATALGVAYHTAEECYYPVIQYVKGNVDSFENVENAQEVACAKTSTKMDWKNTAVLENLEPETEYSLRIGDRGSNLYGDIYHFKTNAEQKTETKFLFMANSKQNTSGYHDGDTDFAKTLATATQFFSAQDMDFLMHGGDYTSSGMMPEYWAGMFEGMKEYVFDMPIVPVAGDMENYAYTNKTNSVFENMFHIDAPSQTKTNGLYYSFNLGPVHVSVLNSNDCIDKHDGSKNNEAGGLITGTGSLVDQQLNWLKDDLDYTRNVNTYIKWNIVVMHESVLLPVYGASDANALKINHAFSLRQQLMQVLQEQKVDLVLSAQDGESFTTNPLTYNNKSVIEVRPLAGQKAGETVAEPWLEKVEVTGTSVDYNGRSVLSFDSYASEERGIVFHQVGAVGLGKTNIFQYSNLAGNLARYNGIYNQLASGIQNGTEISMFSNIEISETALTLRTFGVDANASYQAVGDLPYFGGIQLKKEIA